MYVVDLDFEFVNYIDKEKKERNCKQQLNCLWLLYI